MQKYHTIAPKGGGTFLERLYELYMAAGNYIDMEELAGRRLKNTRIFLSDIYNQEETLLKSDVYQELSSKGGVHIEEYPPLNGAKISLLLQTSDKDENRGIQGLRLTGMDGNGEVAYPGDLLRQTAHILENIGTHLKDNGQRMQDIKFLVIYLKDFSDYHTVDSFMNRTFPQIPRTMVLARTAHRKLLIEIEYKV